MSATRISVISIVLCLLAVSLSACGSINQVAQQFVPTPSPQPTPTPLPLTGQVGLRQEWGGWAINVENVLRSSLNPRELVPGNYHPDELDYISMDVEVERISADRGFVYGEDFTLLDSTGAVYHEDPSDRNWLYVNGEYNTNETGSERIVFPIPETSQGLILRFSPSPELPEPIDIALDQVKEPRRIDLREAIELGLIAADVRGMSLESIEIEIEVTAELEDSLELSIAPGTMFLAPSPDLQTMVVRREMVLFISSKKELSVELRVACANMTLKAPHGGETYIVQIEQPAEELNKLLGLAEFKDSSFRLQQFAIWVITDNPSQGSFVGLGSAGQGSPPTADELAQIRQWFEAAGIAVGNYSSLR